MKMYNANKIIPGLIIFLGLITFPLWYNMGKAAPAPQPKLDTPAIQKMDKKQCVLPAAEMRTGHMQILNDWRTQVVRYDKRIGVYPAPIGAATPEGATTSNGTMEFNMSLQNGCMKCHTNKTEFCDACHNYAGLKSGSTPYCWTCHIAPKENK